MLCWVERGDKMRWDGVVELLWRSHLPPPTWWECCVVNSPTVPLVATDWRKQRPAVPPLVWSLSQCISPPLQPHTPTRRMNPCYCSWESKGETNKQEIVSFHIFLSLIKRRLSRRTTGVGGVSVPYGCVYLMKKKNKLDGLVCRLLLNWSRYLISPENWKINFLPTSSRKRQCRELVVKYKDIIL